MNIIIDSAISIVAILSAYNVGKFLERSRWCRIAYRTFGRLQSVSRLQGGINEAVGRKGKWSVMLCRDEVISITAGAILADREAKAVLNCDVYREKDLANKVWFDWTGTVDGQNEDGTVKLTFAEWLLANYDGR